jgi:hypothetical protein
MATYETVHSLETPGQAFGSLLSYPYPRLQEDTTTMSSERYIAPTARGDIAFMKTVC